MHTPTEERDVFGTGSDRGFVLEPTAKPKSFPLAGWLGRLRRTGLLFLRVDKDTIVHHEHQVIAAVACDIDNERFARFGLIAATTPEGPFFKNLPTRRGHQLPIRIKDHDVEIVLCGFEEDEIAAAVLVQVA